MLTICAADTRCLSCFALLLQTFTLHVSADGKKVTGKIESEDIDFEVRQVDTAQ